MEFRQRSVALGENSPYSNLRGVHLHDEVQRRVSVSQNRTVSKTFLERMEGFVGLPSPAQLLRTSLQEGGERGQHRAETPNEAPEIVGKTKEARQRLDVEWNRPRPYRSDPLLFHIHSRWGFSIAHEGDWC